MRVGKGRRRGFPTDEVVARRVGLLEQIRYDRHVAVKERAGSRVTMRGRGLRSVTVVTMVAMRVRDGRGVRVGVAVTVPVG